LFGTSTRIESEAAALRTTVGLGASSGIDTATESGTVVRLTAAALGTTVVLFGSSSRMESEAVALGTIIELWPSSEIDTVARLEEGVETDGGFKEPPSTFALITHE
jgi:hypothetical protein